MAFRIEKAYSKERILELYLNQIYLGSGTYGIAAASLEYFDKSVKELDYSEAALLAALPKAPSKYNPFRFYEEAKLRKLSGHTILICLNTLITLWIQTFLHH